MNSSGRQLRGAAATEPQPTPVRVWAVADRSALVVALTMMVPEWDVTAITDPSGPGDGDRPDAVIVEAATTSEALAILASLREVGVTAPAVLIGDAAPDEQGSDDDPTGALPSGDTDHALLTRPFTIADVRDRIAVFISTPAPEPIPPPARRGLLARAAEWRASTTSEPTAPSPDVAAGPVREAAITELHRGGELENAAAAPDPVVEKAAETGTAGVPLEGEPVVNDPQPEFILSTPEPEPGGPGDDPMRPGAVLWESVAPEPEPPPAPGEPVLVEPRADDQTTVGESLDGVDPAPDYDADGSARPFDARSLLAEIINAFDPDNAAIWTPAESGTWIAETSHGLHKAEGRAKVRADQPLFAAVSANLDGALLAPSDLARGHLAGVPGSWAEDVMAGGMGFDGECLAVVVVGGSGLTPGDLHRLLVLVNGAAPHRPGLGSKLRDLLHR